MATTRKASCCKELAVQYVFQPVALDPWANGHRQLRRFG